MEFSFGKVFIKFAANVFHFFNNGNGLSEAPQYDIFPTDGQNSRQFAFLQTKGFLLDNRLAPMAANRGYFTGVLG